MDTTNVIVSMLPVLAAIGVVIFAGRYYRGAIALERNVDKKIHAVHEAFLLFNVGAIDEAIDLLAEHDIRVREKVR